MNKPKKHLRNILIILFISIFCFVFYPHKTLASDFNPNSIISDGEFIDINSMGVSEIQNFLNQQGGFLKDYSENGRSAAQIIYDASHGHGEASGSIYGIDINSSTGTVNPKVLLVTLQKEQSLITMSGRNDSALRTAMGYGCPDDEGCNPAYEGFTNQVEWAAWQFRYNYEASAHNPIPPNYGDKYVGNNIHFYNTYPNPYGGPSEQDVHIDNRATASLYRYTPHVYNGNYNFWRLYNQWFEQKQFSSSWAGQSDFASMDYGETHTFFVKYTNTGSSVWYRNTVHLATSHPKDHTPVFNRGPGWVSENRINMQEENVAPGETATFTFDMAVPFNLNPGTYREYFQLVADGVGWMEDYGTFWDITVKAPPSVYSSQWAGQSDYALIAPGQSATFFVRYKNTGTATWYKGKVNLGTSHNRDRVSAFERTNGWTSENRIVMQENSVAPGETATFAFSLTAPANMSLGNYKEYFQLVADGVGWMEDYGVFWDINLDRPHSTWYSQSSYPHLHPGEKSAVTLDFKNTGNVIWYKNGPHPVRLGTDHPRDRSSNFVYSDWISANRITLDQNSVAPGETGRFSFFINVPAATAPGTYREYFTPVSEGLTWLEDNNVFFDIIVE